MAPTTKIATALVMLTLLGTASNAVANEQVEELDVDGVTAVAEQDGAAALQNPDSVPSDKPDQTITESGDGEDSIEGNSEPTDKAQTDPEVAPIEEPAEVESEPSTSESTADGTDNQPEPVPEPEADQADADAETSTAEEELANEESANVDPASPEQDSAWGPLDLFEKTIHPGEKRRITWYPDQSALGLSVPTPVLVARGDREGPALCLTAAIHGDELNGVEMIRRLLLDVDPEELRGTIIGIPIVNTFGFIRSSRYLPDRRDLNRYFPGSSEGSSASRLAAALFGHLKGNCDLLVDIHTGSFHRTNLPQLRADLSNPEVVEFTRDFGATPVLRSRAPGGSLRQAAVNVGIPAVTFEAGEPLRFQPEEVAHGVKALESLLRNREMVSRFSLWNAPQPVFYESSWVRSDGGGILLTRVDLGDIVEEGQLLATVTDPINNTVQELNAPFAGRVLGMALNQVVLPGFAAIHLGRATSEQEAVSSAQSGEPEVDEIEDEGLDPEDPDAPTPESDDQPEGSESERIETAEQKSENTESTERAVSAAPGDESEGATNAPEQPASGASESTSTGAESEAEVASDPEESQD